MKITIMVPVSDQNLQHDAVEAQMNLSSGSQLKPYKKCSNFINEAQISNISIINCDVNTRINFSCDFDVLQVWDKGLTLSLLCLQAGGPKMALKQMRLILV